MIQLNKNGLKPDFTLNNYHGSQPGYVLVCI